MALPGRWGWRPGYSKKFGGWKFPNEVQGSSPGEGVGQSQPPPQAVAENSLTDILSPFETAGYQSNNDSIYDTHCLRTSCNLLSPPGWKIRNLSDFCESKDQVWDSWWQLPPVATLCCLHGDAIVNHTRRLCNLYIELIAAKLYRDTGYVQMCDHGLCRIYLHNKNLDIACFPSFWNLHMLKKCKASYILTCFHSWWSIFYTILCIFCNVNCQINSLCILLHHLCHICA